MYMLAVSGRGHQCPLCVIVVHRHIVVTVGGAFYPWRWPSHCGGTSLSVVMAVVVRCRGLCFMLVPCPSWLWSVVVNEGRQHLSSSFVRVRSGEERVFTHPGLSFCNAKEAPIHHPPLLPCASTLFLTQLSPTPQAWTVVVVVPFPCCCRIIVVWWRRPASSSTHPHVVSLRWRWTTNRSLFVIWLPRRYGQCGTWVVCVSTGMGGGGELSSPAFFRLVMGARGPLWWYRYLALPTSRAPDIECAFVLGRQGAACSLCWRSSPSVGSGDTWPL